MDKKYYRLRELWEEYNVDGMLGINNRNVATFLAHIMFESKVYHIVEDPRRKVWMCNNLVFYLKGKGNYKLFLSKEERELIKLEEQLYSGMTEDL